jgi:hypothetical protein
MTVPPKCLKEIIENHLKQATPQVERDTTHRIFLCNIAGVSLDKNGKILDGGMTVTIPLKYDSNSLANITKLTEDKLPNLPELLQVNIHTNRNLVIVVVELEMDKKAFTFRVAAGILRKP